MGGAVDRRLPRRGRTLRSDRCRRKGFGRERRAIIGTVGLNPFRQHRRSTFDYLLVAAALVVCAALVAWAFLG